ncbi:MAG: sodium:alanine symporter family protein [Peptostreptococcaceae bacterium]|nr:sodium:alanine symporter family protein [Peptostreptococcaceae bacterium]
MQSFTNTIVSISNFFWGPPILATISALSIYISIRLGFFQFTKFGYIFKSTLGQAFKKGKGKGDGTLTPFQALTSAVACTVGAGNIVGVPVAIIMGGPGAVFWMWLIAFLGMALKYSEIVLAVKYRQLNEKGEYVGGPTYYMDKGMNMKWLAGIFAIGLMIEVAISSMVQANSLAQSADAALNIPPIVSGIATMIITGIVVIGGVKRIGNFTVKLVPFMAMLYIISSCIIIALNFDKIPEAFALIFKYAFSPIAATGGFAGTGVAMAIRWGVARGLYSNESGLGTAPIAHATATTDHPSRQGLWGVMEVFLDTIVICSVTAFVILTTGVWKLAEASTLRGGITALAFTKQFGSIGGAILTICLIMFVLSTLIVLIWYGEKQAEYLFGLKASIVYRILCVLLIPIGAVGGAQMLWQFLDFSLLLILFPNLFAIIYLSKDVINATNEFFKTPDQYYLKEKRELKERLGNSETK